MVDSQEIRGRWNEVRGRLREHWGELTDDDLQSLEGSAEQLVGVVQQKTGAAKSEIEQFLDRILGNGGLGKQAAQGAQQATASAQMLADEATEYARYQVDRLASHADDYSQKLVRTIRERPSESLAIAFGVGIAAGALLFFNRRAS